MEKIMNKKLFLSFIALILLFSLSACDTLEQLDTGGNTTTNKEAIASGTFSANEVAIASLIGGEVNQVYFDLGDQIKQGELVLSLNTDMIDHQIRQSEAAVTAAETMVNSSILAYDQAKIEYQNLEQQLRMNEIERLAANWQEETASEYDLPAWYFNRDDTYQAALSELDSAQAALAIEQKNLISELDKASNADIVEAEKRLASAHETYRISESVLEAANQAKDNNSLKDAAQEQLDAAKAELEAAQFHYDQILSSPAADAVLEARARLAAAQKRFDLAQNRVDSLSTGENSLSLKAASLQMEQSNLMIKQAKDNLEQTKAALDTLKTQRAKHNLYSPIDGVVLSRTIEPGEMLTPSTTALVIGQLDTLTLKIYLPEDEYGKVQLGTEVEIMVDSFPGERFSGTIVYISDKAEYTPRNVQTVEGRHSTVYAVEIRVNNLDHQLKPGMPADVLLSSLN
jgi:multidrug efflux pump subunit AcrA (membrane-fusion protein)